MWRCARWSSTSPAARCRRASCPTPSSTPAGPGDVLVEVHACGVCRTDLHIRDGEVRGSRLPVIPGHQIVATVLAAGPGRRARAGRARGHPVAGLDRRDVPLLHERAREPLRARAVHRPGPRRRLRDARRGRRRYAFALPEGFGDLEAAPLLCAGLIGHRALRMTGDAQRLGLYGFGASAHIVCQVALHQGRRVFAFTRAGDDGLAGLRARARLRVGRRRAGPARPRSSTRRSSSPPSASSCPRRCAPSAAAASSCARAST